MLAGMNTMPDPTADQDGGARSRERHHDVDVRVRRSPKFGVFMAIGAVIGAIVAWVVSAVQPPGVDVAGQPVDTSGVLGLAIVAGVVLGVGAGAVVALIVDRSLSKRGRMLVAEQTDTEPAEQPQAVASPADAGEASFEPLQPGAPAATDRAPARDRSDPAQEHDRPSGA